MVVSQLHSTRHLQTMSLCLFAKLILPDLEQRIVATRQILAENGNLLTLQYFLLKERTPFQKEKFGVMIQERSGGEKALAPNLSTSAAQVFQLIRRLADCTVTPTALADVLADWEGTL